MISVCFQGNSILPWKSFNIMVIQVYVLTSKDEEAQVEWFYEDLQDLLKLTSKKLILFIIGEWNAKVGSQVIPGVTGKFGLGVQNEAGQKLMVLPRERAGHSEHLLPTREESTNGHHQTVNTEIRWIIFFAVKDGEALYSQQKQD